MDFTRREFLKAVSFTMGGVAASGSVSALDAFAADASSLLDKSRVVVARSKSLLSSDRTINRKAADGLVTSALCSLTGQSDPREGWRSLFDPADVVGIKVNCIGKRSLSSQVEIVESLVSGLSSIGVKKIIVWDRFSEELDEAGYPVRLNGGPYLCFGTNQPGVGYSPTLLSQGEIGSLFSRILTDLCTALINVPLMKDHDIAGVTAALKNNFGVIHNPNKYHFDNLHAALADLNSMDLIRKKTRLVVCDASRVVYNGGPAFKPQWTDWFGGIVASRDPVAVDAESWRTIEGLRKMKGLPTLAEAKRLPKYIELASKPPYSLGHGAEKEIERTEVEL